MRRRRAPDLISWVSMPLLAACLAQPAAAAEKGKPPPKPPDRTWGVVWNPAPTIVALVEGSTELMLAAQTAVAPSIVLEAAIDVAVQRGLPPAVGARAGAGYNPLAAGLRGPIVGLYPGYLFFLSPRLPGAATLSARLQEQWLSGFGLIFTAGLGVSYLFRPLDLFKWDLSLGIGFAFPRAP